MQQSEADRRRGDLPTCPECGTRDTWEARQGGRFRGIVGAIDACPSLEELAALGKRLYALALTHDQAGVAWSHYHLRKTALEAGRDAPAAGARAPGRSRGARQPRDPCRSSGAQLYRLQHAGAVSVSAAEWRRIWAVYRGRRGAVGA